ncbi:DUF1775 domain-containing protein [Actinoplanes sp. NPDC051494]|uniref:DUF1775 domain-containing protein n=1 Tax=Actinoplanes sp. NPDC051494 TaxID=3363907 RepID=UPI003795F6C3
MSRLEKHRRAGVLAATVAAGVLGLAAPAAADVAVSPSSAPQGSAQNFSFTLTNTGRSPIKQLKVVLPAAQPIAEVYPLSVDDWAPRLEHRTLDTPLAVPNGEPLTQVVGAITWIAMPGKELAPGASAHLDVAIGPVPTAGEQMTFTVEPAYVDPAKGDAMPPVSLTLTPAVAGETYSGHAAHTGGDAATGDTSATDEQMFEALAEAADDGPSFWTIAGWVLAGLLAVTAAVTTLRGRRRPTDEPASDAGDEQPELVAAGPDRSKWSYKG